MTVLVEPDPASAVVVSTIASVVVLVLVPIVVVLVPVAVGDVRPDADVSRVRSRSTESPLNPTNIVRTARTRRGERIEERFMEEIPLLQRDDHRVHKLGERQVLGNLLRGLQTVVAESKMQ